MMCVGQNNDGSGVILIIDNAHDDNTHDDYDQNDDQTQVIINISIIL